MSRITLTLALLSLSLLPSVAEAALPKVLVIGASSSSPPEVAHKLMITNAFSVVDVLYANNTGSTPTLTKLKTYDAVVVYSYLSFDDPVALGDVLADYVEAGGGVVLFDYETLEATSGYQLEGRYASTYTLMTPQDFSAIQDNVVTMGQVLEVGSPILAGVSSFGCASSTFSCHHLSSAVQRGTVVARWSDGTPMVLRGTINGHIVVEINSFAVSDDTAHGTTIGEWDSTTDGAILIKNAVLYTLGPVKFDKGDIKFGSLGLGTTSAPVTITYSNTGAVAASLNTLTLGGANPTQFVATPAQSLPATIAPGGTFTVDVVFKPTSVVGPLAATLTIESSGGQMQSLITTLSGTSIGPVLTFSPTPLDLGGVKLSQPLTGKFKLTNSGGGSANISAITVTTDAASFSVTPQMAVPFSLGAGASVDVDVSFSSAVAGAHAGVVSVSSQLAPVTLPLKATTGDPKIGLDSGSVIMAAQHVGSTSPATALKVLNQGFSDLTVTSITLSGADAADFTLTLPTLPAVIPAGGSVGYSVTFKPSALGTRTASIGLASDDPVTPALTQGIQGVGESFMESIAPTSLDFGTVKGGQTASRVTVLSNTSAAPLKITGITFTGAQMSLFKLMNPPTLPSSVPAKGTQSFTVIFAPTMAGNADAVLTITIDDPNMAMISVPLKGVATASILGISPMALDFGPVNVKNTSPAKTVTLKNTGNAPVTVSSLTLSGTGATSYSMPTKPTTPLTIAAGAMVTVDVQFTPLNHSSLAAQLNIVSDDPLLPMGKVTLTGAGVQAKMLVNPLDMDFGTLPVGVASAAKQITVTNTGDTDLVLYSVDSSDVQFSADTKIPAIKPGDMAVINVRFLPTMGGTFDATLRLAPDDLNLVPAEVTLHGVGVSPKLNVTPTALVWPVISVGKTGDPQTVTLTNMTDVALTLSMISASDPAHFPIDKTNLILTLAPGAKASFDVTFAPTDTGSTSGTIVIKLEGATKALVTVALKGEGLLVREQMTGCACALGARPSSPSSLPVLALPLLLLLGLSLRRRRR